MDSMRHLSTSLPNPRRRIDHSELLADFKAAALSVTNLYKTAASSQDKARAAGYQDALDDVLTFLDKENLGLGDGEGWRVRQWATERLVDESGVRQMQAAGSDNGNDNEEDDEQQGQTRSSSPDVQRKAAVPMSSSETRDPPPSPRRSAMSEPPQSQPQLQIQTPPRVPTLDTFTFRSQHPYATNHERDSISNAGMDVDSHSTTSSSAESVRIIPRPSGRGRHIAHVGRRANANNANVTTVPAGSKRKMPYPDFDFFDISNINLEGLDRKDGTGGRGGKRGRYV